MTQSQQLTIKQALSRAKKAAKKGKIAIAVELYTAVLAIQPKHPVAKKALYKLQKGSPDNKTLQVQELMNLYNQGQLQEVIQKAETMVADFPKDIILLNLLGAANAGLHRYNDAIESYKKAVKINPSYAEAHNNLSSALIEKNDLVSAIESCNHAISVKPDYAEAHNNLGYALQGSGNLRSAIASYSRAIEIRPDYAEAHNNLGVALAAKGDQVGAIESYTCAIDIKPHYANAYNNRAVSLLNRGEVSEAIQNCKRALEISPDHANAHHNMGNALLKNADPEAAINSYQKALKVEPDFVTARSQKLFQQAYICDWEAIEQDRNLIPALGIETDSVAPFTMLPLEDHPARHLKRSASFASYKFEWQPAVLPKVRRPPQNPSRVRLGYLSGDFHAHPVMRLIVKMFELHDRENFEVHAFSCSPGNNDAMRDQLIKNFDAFHDVSDMQDQEIAEFVRKAGIDIAIDLTGYTANARDQILAYRAAPIQVSYLGYPGSMGANFIDYLIADCTLVPIENHKFYSEKIVHLPNCYQVSSHLNSPPSIEGGRADLDLPEEGFIFCCFNDHYKITSREFDIWMRLLGKVQGSVLWLRQSNKSSEANLKKAAQDRTIDPDRLIFAKKCDYHEYLIRMTKADLFLDTFNYNAGAVANDALWSGLPILTKQGEGYAARMASSLLNAIDLPELITSNENDYEKIALDLATHPGKLKSLKTKLSINRDSTSLFDTARATKNIETAYTLMYERYLANKKPGHLFIKE